MSDHMEAAVEAAAEALFEESQGLDQENDWGDDLPQEWREEWKYVAREINTADLPHISAMIAAELNAKGDTYPAYSERRGAWHSAARIAQEGTTK